MEESYVLIVTAFFMSITIGRDLSANTPQPPNLPAVGPTVIRLPALIKSKDINLSVPEEFRVDLLIDGLSFPRWLLALPNGDLLVSQSRTESLPGMPEETVKLLASMNIFGPSPNNILYIDLQKKEPKVKVILENLNQPFGMLYLNEELFIANTDSIIKYDFKGYKIQGNGEKIISLPAGPPNNHWTRNLILNQGRDKILVAIGSGTNVNEEGTDDLTRAAIWEINLDGQEKRLFATGLRNPVGLAFEPITNRLWTTVNERDGLGEDLPPDFLTEVIEGAFYGWPYAYFGVYPDPTQLKMNPQKTKEAMTTSRVPDLALEAHSVPLGLLFHSGNNINQKYKHGAFIARRGGVSRSQLTGYDLIYVPFENGYPTGEVQSFLSGFVANQDRGEIYGRPVGLAELTDGSILLTDDVAGRIWRISKRD